MGTREYIEARSIPIPFAGCWLWLLSFGSHGYGNASTPKARVDVAHRVSYRAFKGEIPDGMLVQHSCDNKWCVNPDHLSLGTDATNAVDKQLKGRAARRLEAEDVEIIRALLRRGKAKRAIARLFEVAQKTIQMIERGNTWNHVA